MRSELGVILSVVLLAILSIVFGVMAYMNYSTLDPGDDPKKKLDAQIEEKRRNIKNLKEGEKGIDDYQLRKDRLSEDIVRLQEQQKYLIFQRQEYVTAHERRMKHKEEGVKYKAQADDMAVKVAAGKKVVSDHIQAEIARLRTEMEKSVEADNAKKAKIQAEVLQKKGEYDTSAKRHGQDMNYVKSQLGDTKQVLADLTTREEVRANILNRIDGKVVLADPVHDIVSIDVGTGMGVKNGFRFEVFTLLPGNKHVTKAYIEVRKAGPTQSECLVIRRPVVLPADDLNGYVAPEPEYVFNPYIQSGKKSGSAEQLAGGKVVMSGQSATNPILEGDYVQNPFFESGKQLVFYIAGSKEMVGERQKSAIRYRWTEIKDAAERHGAKVVDTISTDVNYVIAQKNPQDDPEYKKAVDLGIPVMYEWELFRFLDNN